MNPQLSQLIEVQFWFRMFRNNQKRLLYILILFLLEYLAMYV